MNAIVLDLNALGRGFICILVLLIVAALVRNIWGWGVDATDRSAWHRSGLKIYTDNETGVQYVSDGNSLVIRIDPTGKPMVKK